jgi:thromboxane-A synthase
MIVTFILFLILLSVYLLHVHVCYQFFKRLRIGGPSPTFFLGNVGDFARTQRMSISIRNWTKQFGRIYGYFEGHTPILVISDPDILNKIFLQHFSKFHSRRQFPLEDRSTTKGVHLFSATGDKWRRQRSIINPTFSPLKIKRMLPIINDCVSDLMIKLEEFTETASLGFDIYKSYKSLTMDLIWRCCFSIKTDMQSNPNNPYLVRSQQVFAKENSTYVTTLLGIFIPELQTSWLLIHGWINNIKSTLRQWLPMGEKLIDDDPSEWLKQNVTHFIENASQNSDDIDLLHLMLDATEKKSNNTNQVSFQNKINHILLSFFCKENTNERLLTLNEVKQNIYLFMIAGYETASTALAYITHVLATNPEEQRKLQDHIDAFISADTVIDYELINKMEYLDWFIRETLRMYPITPIIINRECSEEIYLPELGCILPGTKLTLDMYSLHYDIDLWGPVDTKIFYPERFATKRHPLAWVAFGAGPRNCVGMRFAMAEMKIAIIRLLQNYTVLPSTLAKKDLELVELVTIAPKELLIQLKRRADR